MKTMVLNSDKLIAQKKSHGVTLERFAKKFVLKVLNKLEVGRIVLEDGDKVMRFGQADDSVIEGRITVLNPAFYADLLRNGSIGCGESFMWQHWKSDDLVTLVRVIVLNLHILDGVDGGQSWFRKIATRVLHRLNANDLEGSRRNISAHYDLSNEFFESFLDPTMMYSSAIFADETMSLHEASLEKLRHICSRLQLKTTDHLLEIGTGWGSMAIYAAKHYGCRVTTTTLSQQQYDYTEKQIREEGLEDRIELLLEDYRDLRGSYDKLVSIEMIEAVGHEFYSSYFTQCSTLLKSDGLMLIQAICISDQRYDQAKQSVDFIQRYIFPGGCLPSNSVIAKHVSENTNMQIIGLEDITKDYALTLAHWRQRFLANTHTYLAQGLSSEFLLMWDYYLAYCQGGFMERVIHTSQTLIAKPNFRDTPSIGTPAP